MISSQRHGPERSILPDRSGVLACRYQSMRAVAFVLSLTLSGMISLEAQAVEPPPQKTAEQAAPCGGCPGEPEKDCSPVCHDCVCSIGARSVAPTVNVLAVPALTPLVGEVACWNGTHEAPRAPALDGVFHPPKL